MRCSISKKGIIFTMFMLCIYTLANAQSWKGTILDSEDSLPISGAHIYIPNSSIGTVSNAQGVFTLSVHPHGDVIGYDLKVSTDHLQYFPEQQIRIKYNGKKIKAIARITNEVGSIRYFKHQDNWFVRNIDNEIAYDILNDNGEILTTFNSLNKVIVYDMSPIDNLATGQKVNIHKEIKPSSPYSPAFWDALHVLEYTEVESQVREDLEKKTSLVNQFEQ